MLQNLWHVVEVLKSQKKESDRLTRSKKLFKNEVIDALCYCYFTFSIVEKMPSTHEYLSLNVSVFLRPTISYYTTSTKNYFYCDKHEQIKALKNQQSCFYYHEYNSETNKKKQGWLSISNMVL